MLRKMKTDYLLLILIAFSQFFLIACSENENATEPEKVELGPLFKNCDVELDEDHFVIELSAAVDSLKVSSLEALGGIKYYLALDGDLVDPDVDWDNPLDSGALILSGDKGFANIVVLDKNNRVVSVWQIEKTSSSSAKSESSSSFEKNESSSSADLVKSSSSVEKSDSNEKSDSSSSSQDESSSSVGGGLKEEIQLIGSDFSKREESFWATTSDLMSTSATVAGIKIESSANLEFAGGKAILTTREIVGSLSIIPGSWKVAGGFYFAGSFAANDIVQIYQWNYTSGTPDAGYASDISQGMTFGRPFTARPTAFEVKYSYEHVANTSEDYPQKSLMYVMLVSDDNKVVASGMHSDCQSVGDTLLRVDLNYGSDPDGLLTGGFAIAQGFTLGLGTEKVSSIHVMFASSAYAHVVAGGAAGSGSKQRGGKNAKLVLDNFKLIY